MTAITSIAIYARVSTKQIDKLTGQPRQNPESQLLPLRAYAAQRGLKVYSEYVDREKGTKENRLQLQRMMADARQHKFDAILVWKFDRFARSITHLLRTLEELNAMGLGFISVTEQIDTSTPMGRAMFAIIGAMAQLERDLIAERVTTGAARIRACHGTLKGHWGKRPKDLRQPIPESMPCRQAARLCGVSRSTISRRRKESATN